MNKVVVKVNGVEYTLKGEEKEEYLQSVAAYVDKKVQMILDKNSKLSSTDASVLASMNIADELFKWDKYIAELEDKNSILKSSQKGYNDKINELQAKIDELEKNASSENTEEIKKELDDLRNNYIELDKKYVALQEKYNSAQQYN